ncbi:hypothetical protein BSL78_23364 [Apostichopus japonicus]|uniref:Uncharacterized protein n=1 Tax=Stichopus japonicus TaxID=307972 RepID=A0A2G8JVJ4_STIJA|nr:hypothetical protein BSL78_23364 [Apostichopus japonicus]
MFSIVRILSNISISSIPANIFNSTSLTKSLDLSNNNLTTIPETLFSSGNTQHFLYSLSLSDNQLEAIPPKLFHNLTHLMYLYLDGNKLVELPEGMLSLTSVEFLRIQSDETNFCGIPSSTLSCDGIHIPMMPYNWGWYRGSRLPSLPEGTNKSTHAGYRACFCLENYFRRDRFGGCKLCPRAGLRCSNDFVTIEPGFYWNWTFANITEYRLFVDNLKTCEYSFNENTTSYSGSFPYVHPCRQTFKCDNKNDTIEGNCHRGYRGFMCTECAERYFPVLNFCHVCPQIWVFALEVVLVLVLCACLLGYLIYTYNRQRLEEGRSIVDVTLARGKIVLGFYQVMGEFWDSLDVNYWPEVFKRLSNWLVLLQFNISNIFIKPSCFFPKVSLNAYSEFLIGITVTSVVVLVPAIAICFRKIRATYIQRQFSNNASSHPRFIFKQDRLWLATLLTLYITYPSTCYSIITLYSPACQSFALDDDMRHNVTLLRSDLTINCNTEPIGTTKSLLTSLRLHHSFSWSFILPLKEISKTAIKRRSNFNVVVVFVSTMVEISL